MLDVKLGDLIIDTRDRTVYDVEYISIDNRLIVINKAGNYWKRFNSTEITFDEFNTYFELFKGLQCGEETLANIIKNRTPLTDGFGSKLIPIFDMREIPELSEIAEYPIVCITGNEKDGFDTTCFTVNLQETIANENDTSASMFDIVGYYNE